MSNFLQAVVGAFAADGVLATSTPNYQPRSGQNEMALAIAAGIEQGGELVVEAGTGVGKTYAYLIPVLLSGQRALISTATKALQDQLFSRDIPRLVTALGLPVKVALLKGRGSYLCLQRLEQARQGHEASTRVYAQALSKIETWSHATKTGDLAELSGLDDRSPVIAWVTSTRDNCLGSQCPQFRACHVNLARKEAMASDVVVINHHLFFADLNVRESGMAELLPSVQAVVFDEAHQLNEIGIQFLGRHVSSGQLLELARDMLGAGLQWARGLVDWAMLANALEKSARDLRLTASHARAGARLSWTDAAPQDTDPQAWSLALAQLQLACQQALRALEAVLEMAPDFVRLHERVRLASELTAHFDQTCTPGSVRWVEVGAQIRLVESPLDIADAVQTHMIQDKPGPSSSTSSAGVRRAWVFTSATLGEDDNLRWFTEPCGLSAAQILRVVSPFDYAQQACFYVPVGMPRPNDESHIPTVALWVEKNARQLGGRTLVLTTTLNAMRLIGEALTAALGHSGELEVLVQGQGPKRRLMERFRQGTSGGEKGCVLVASASFWEGFDVPGEALQMVVIDKLPFPPPNDPLVQARSQRLELSGKSAFSDYSVPEAAIALKQGAGRLIRSESDQGILVVCDPRLTSMAYGRRLIASLPPMQKLSTELQFQSALDRLTKASTTDCL